MQSDCTRLSRNKISLLSELFVRNSYIRWSKISGNPGAFEVEDCGVIYKRLEEPWFFSEKLQLRHWRFYSESHLISHYLTEWRGPFEELPWAFCFLVHLPPLTFREEECCFSLLKRRQVCSLNLMYGFLISWIKNGACSRFQKEVSAVLLTLGVWVKSHRDEDLALVYFRYHKAPDINLVHTKVGNWYYFGWFLRNDNFGVFAEDEEGQEIQIGGKIGWDPLCNQLKASDSKIRGTCFGEGNTLVCQFRVTI